MWHSHYIFASMYLEASIGLIEKDHTVYDKASHPSTSCISETIPVLIQQSMMKVIKGVIAHCPDETLSRHISARAAINMNGLR